MGKNGKAGQDRGRGTAPGGEECARTVGAGNGQSIHPTPLCDLCFLLRDWRVNSEGRQAVRQVHLGLQIVLVDGDEAVCRSARQMVQAQRDGWTLEAFHACGAAEAPLPAEAAPSRAALEAPCPQALRPDIVLAGIGASCPSRLGCLRKLKALAPDLPVVVISGQADEAWLLQCFLAGADGCLLNPAAPEAIARAVNSAVQGWPAFCPEAEKAVMNFAHRMGAALWSRHLSRREQEIVVCLAQKLPDKEIAERLGIAECTVHVHLVRLFRKLGVHTRAQVLRELLPGEVV